MKSFTILNQEDQKRELNRLKLLAILNVNLVLKPKTIEEAKRKEDRFILATAIASNHVKYFVNESYLNIVILKIFTKIIHELLGNLVVIFN